jgi:predicted nucleotidyltransferase
MRQASATASVPRTARSMLSACKRIIQERVPDATVVLFGSRARGDSAPDSDYDLLVLTDAPLTSAEEDRISDAVYDLELERGVVISLIIFPRAYWDRHRLMPLHQEVDREGIVL